MLVHDYPHTPKVRWGHGKPNHGRLEALLEAGAPRYARLLRTITRYKEPLCRISVDPTGDSGEPFYRNSFLPGLDCAALYSITAELKPRHYVEIGSGNSTRFVRRAIRDQSLATEVISV